MIRSSMNTHPSAMARAMGEVGDGWMLLTLWSTLNGITRFEEMLQELGVARNILADRLRRLVESGLLERRPIGTRVRGLADSWRLRQGRGHPRRVNRAVARRVLR